MRKPAHGTNSRYMNYDCRCNRCKKAHADAQRNAARARNVALRRLRDEFPDRYAAIYAEEKVNFGVRATAGRPPKVDA